MRYSYSYKQTTLGDFVIYNRETKQEIVWVLSAEVADKWVRFMEKN